jgi:hypothetical protein
MLIMPHEREARPAHAFEFSEKKYHTPFVLPQHAKRADEVEEYRNAENVGPVRGVSIWFEDHNWKSGGRVRLEWKNSAGTAGPKGPIRLSLSNIRPSIGTENPIPEEMDHREIAVRVPVMNEVQFLFPSEPCKPLQPRSLHVVFLVEKDVRIKRRRTCDYLSHEEIDRASLLAKQLARCFKRKPNVATQRSGGSVPHPADASLS